MLAPRFSECQRAGEPCSVPRRAVPGPAPAGHGSGFAARALPSPRHVPPTALDSARRGPGTRSRKARRAQGPAPLAPDGSFQVHPTQEPSDRRDAQRRGRARGGRAPGRRSHDSTWAASAAVRSGRVAARSSSSPGSRARSYSRCRPSEAQCSFSLPTR